MAYKLSIRENSAALASTAPSERYGTEGEIRELVRQFENRSLPRSQWTHGAHLTVALWYLIHHPGEQAAMLIRSRIRRYNAAHGVKTTRTSGYHETITMFWVWAVGKYLLLEGKGRPLVELVNGLLATYGDKNFPLRYYSRERLMALPARLKWVEPDLKPLD